MEICGGQTHTLMRSGIDRMLPPEITLVHGPGCPVCVTPLELIDRALAIAPRPDVIFTSFGDMLRVPGSTTRPAVGQGEGRRRAHRLLAARRRDARRGRTPTGRSSSSRSASRRRRPPTRWRSSARSALGLTNFSILVSHVLVPPAMEAILSSPAEPGAGVPRRRARLHRDGLRRVRADRRALPGPDRRHRLRAARPPAGHLHGASQRSRRAAPRSRTSTRARSRARATRPAQRRRDRGLRGRATAPWRGIGVIPKSGYRLRPELRGVRRRR